MKYEECGTNRVGTGYSSRSQKLRDVALSPTLKQSSPQDFDLLYSINKSAIKENMERAIGAWVKDDQYQYFKDSTLFPENFIIEYNNQSVGFITIKKLTGRIHIEKFCILPEFQNRGIGSQILDIILQDLEPHLKVTLQLFYNNPVIALYLRHGFSEYRRNSKYIYLEYTKP